MRANVKTLRSVPAQPQLKQRVYNNECTKVCSKEMGDYASMQGVCDSVLTSECLLEHGTSKQLVKEHQ